MCQSCWADHGQPTELPDQGPKAVELIKELYNTPGGETGGPLHTQLDDWNLGDNWTLYVGHTPPLPGVLRIADQIAFLMRQWTVEQQAAVLATAQGYTDGGPVEQEGVGTPPERHS